MNLEQMKENLNESWNKSLITIGVSLVAVVFLLEMLVFGISYGGERIDISVSEYLIKKVFVPSGMNCIQLLFMFWFYKCETVDWICRHKAGLLCYSLFVMFATTALTYRYFHVLWIAPCVCQYLHSVYSGRKGVFQIYIITNIFVIVTIVVAIFDGEYKWDYFAMTAVCALGMLFIIYSVTKLLSGFHTEQLEYMQENYNRQEELIRELKIEPMTGLYNRNALKEKIDRIVQINEKKQQESYLAMLDLDHFKRVNDTYGHVSGDVVIRQAASLIKKHMNADVEGFRFGGEEFLLVFHNKTRERVLSILEQICREMEESQFDFETKLTVTFSVGVAAFETDMDCEGWIQKADEALYYAKENGRNQIKMANSR